ncbi:YncE family protein [Streptomyces sp. NPDC005498]|uniref:YncE family protein n=1 Tax=Streptomyces sp. NPDC005498 TaxID=3364717 RepID=UPI0036A1E774
MRIRRRAAGAALVLVAASFNLLGGPGTAAAQSQGGIVLPVQSHWQTLADSRHVYFSAPGDDAVLATDHDGQVVKKVEGLDGARGMAESADESTLYVALPDADAISVIDTATLSETRRISTGADTEPESLALAGGRLFFGYQATVFDAGIGSVAIAEAIPTVSLDDNPVWYGKPRLASSPGAPDRLVAADSQGAVGMRVYDVSSGTLEETAYTDAIADVEDMAVTLDGSSVITANGYDYYHQRWRLSDLTPEDRYDTGPYPNSVAVDSHGTVAAGIVAGGVWDVYIYRPGETAAYRTVALSPGYADLLDRGMAWAPDGNRLFTTRFPGGEFVLDIVTDVDKASSTLTLSAPPTNPAGTPVTVTGKLTSLAPFPKRRAVTVTRDGVALPDVKVGRDGTFNFSDTPPEWNTYPQYTVTYAGDARHVPGTATVMVEFVS